MVFDVSGEVGECALDVLHLGVAVEQTSRYVAISDEGRWRTTTDEWMTK